MSLIGLLYRPAADNSALAKIAARRYPDAPGLLGIEMVLSDRRQAGLGALDPAKRRARGPICNRKSVDWMTGRVRYDLMINQDEAFRIPRGEVPFPSVEDAAGAVLTLIKVAARREARVLPVEPHTLESEGGREYVAAMLRRVRREMRPSTDPVAQSGGTCKTIPTAS